MENSIEEDMKILETLDYLLDDVYSTNLVNDEERNKYQYAIEYILSDYKRVLKENEIYKKNKVKDKIEELEKDEYSKYYYMFLEERDLKYTIQILQELLEKE